MGSLKRVTVMPTAPEYARAFPFSFLLPAAWQRMDLPPEEPDFRDPTVMVPLGLYMAAQGAIFFSVAARPGFENGTVEDWLGYFCETQRYEVDAIEPYEFDDGLEAISCLAIQATGAGPLKMRLVLLEDDGTQFAISGIAPAGQWEQYEDLLERMVASFELTDPQGPTVHLTQVREDAAADEADELESPAAEPARVEEGGGDDVEAEQDVDVEDDEDAAAEPLAQFSDFALADHSGSLDENHPVNLWFQQQGRGKVPRVLLTDRATRTASVALAGFGAVLVVPMGWHVIEDGGRAVLFTPDNRVQIHLSLVPNTTPHAAVEATIDATVDQHPDVGVLRLDRDELPGVVFTQLVINGKPWSQLFLFGHTPLEGQPVIKVRLTAPPDDFDRAVGLVNLVLRQLEFQA